MLDSNFYILTHYRLTETRKERRLKHLENTLQQLKGYRANKAPKAKRRLLARLIVRYESLIDLLKQ